MDRLDEEGAMARFKHDLLGIGALLALIAAGLIIIGL
jgi:hypothetical protein